MLDFKDRAEAETRLSVTTHYKFGRGPIIPTVRAHRIFGAVLPPGGYSIQVFDIAARFVQDRVPFVGFRAAALIFTRTGIESSH